MKKNFFNLEKNVKFVIIKHFEQYNNCGVSVFSKNISQCLDEAGTFGTLCTPFALVIAQCSFD